MPEPDVYWPRDTLAPRKPNPEVTPATTGGGRGITAVEQISAFDAGYWTIVLGQIPVAGREKLLAFRGIAGILDGRTGTCGVPIYDDNNAPWPLNADGSYDKNLSIALPHSDGTFFSDGSGYSQPVIVAEAGADAAMGAVAMQINMIVGSTLQPGMHFSVDNRLYRIKQIISSTPSGSTIIYQVKVNLPLREEIPAGTSLDFDDPRCICRLKTDGEMMNAPDDYNGQTVTDVTFVEAVNV